jgi:hypothetical protein
MCGCVNIDELRVCVVLCLMLRWVNMGQRGKALRLWIANLTCDTFGWGPPAKLLTSERRLRRRGGGRPSYRLQIWLGQPGDAGGPTITIQCWLGRLQCGGCKLGQRNFVYNLAELGCHPGLICSLRLGSSCPDLPRPVIKRFAAAWRLPGVESFAVRCCGWLLGTVAGSCYLGRPRPTTHVFVCLPPAATEELRRPAASV